MRGYRVVGDSDKISSERGETPVTWRAASLAILLGVGGVHSPAPAVGAPVQAQAPAPSTYHQTNWTTREGAPADIWAITQGDDGYLWLGTGTGLYRFDGIRFTPYQPEGGYRTPSTSITALYSAANGDLWIGFLLGGAAVLRDGKLSYFPKTSGAFGHMVMGFAQDRSGTLWAVSGSGLARFANDTWQHVGPDWGVPPGRANSILVDSRGVLWVTLGNHLLFLRPGARRFEDSGEATAPFGRLAEAPNGRLWLSDGLHGTRALLGRDAPRAAPANTDFAHLAFLHFDRNGVLWGTDRTAGGVLRSERAQDLDDGRSLSPADVAPRIGKAQGLPSDKAIPLLEDREGNIWVGTNLGLTQFRPSSVQTLSEPGPNYQYGHSIASTGEGTVVVSSRGTLYRLVGNGLKRLLDIAPASILGVCRDSEGTLWFLSTDTLWRLRDGTTTAFPFPRDGHAPNPSSLAAAPGAGVVLALEEDGLYRADAQGLRRLAGPELDSHTTALLAGQHGSVWLGYPGSRVLRWQDGHLTSYGPDQGLAVGTISALAELDNELVVAGEAGLARIHDGQISTIHAEPGDVLHGITGIVRSARGDLWLNGIRGVLQVRAEDWARLRDQPMSPLNYRLYDFNDGLPGVALQSQITATASVDRMGRIWLATNQGPAYIDPSRLQTNTLAPPVAIEALSSAGRHFPLAGAELPEGTTELRIDYTALSLSIPARVRFRYYLAGVDRDWQDAQGRRSAYYTNLGPGDYRFRVMAANDSDVWNETGAELRFRITPRFVQTPWFLALCFLAALAALFLAYLMHMRQVATRLRERMEGRHLERERIARELHDTLLQSIQGLVLRFQAIARKVPRHDNLRIAMESALDLADEVIAEGRDRVRDLRTEAATASLGLPDALHQLGAELAAEEGPEFHFAQEGRAWTLDPIVRDEIYQIAREALANAFRHARARTVSATLRYERTRLVLRVGDDGCGLPEEVLETGAKPGHWGLTGMCERADTLGATLRFSNHAGAGLDIELSVPIEVARYGLERERNRTWSRRRAASS